MTAKIKIEEGMKYGRLTLTGKEETRRKWRTKTSLRFVECVCDCGNVVRKSLGELRFGSVKSCGCLVRDNAKKWQKERFGKHGMANSRIYRTYQGIKSRINNEKHRSYKYYGGRGIKCMRNSFEDFYKDMGKSYEEHVKQFGERDTTIDRIDHNGDYCKENCRWSTWKEQMHNRDIVDIYGFNYNNISRNGGEKSD